MSVRAALNHRLRLLFASAAAFAALTGLMVPTAEAQPAACPPARIGEPIPLEMGVDAGRRREFAAAAWYFEQHKACVEANRPNVRDHLNAMTSERLVSAYHSARDLRNIARVTDDVLTWYPVYVAGLQPGKDKREQTGRLYNFYFLNAFSYGGADPGRRESTLERAFRLESQTAGSYAYAVVEAHRLYMTLAFNRQDWRSYERRQRQFIDLLRGSGAEYQRDLYTELISFSGYLMGHNRNAEAAPFDAEAQRLAPSARNSGTQAQ
jgi:hypothetical protein